MASIADVYVTVLPETSKIADGIKKAFLAVDKDAREAGGRWKKEIESQLKDVKVKVGADTTKAKAEIDAIDGKTVTVNVDVDRSKLDSIFGGGSGGGGGFGGLPGGGGAFKLNAGLVGIGLLPAAATAITDVAGAIQQLAGAGAVLPGVFAGVASSIGVAKLSTQGMSDAFDAVTKAADGTQKSVDAANKALADLSPNAADTIKTVVGLKGTFEDLRNIGSQNLFSGVSGGLKALVTADLPAATRGIDGISRSLNQNLLQAMTSLGSGSSQGFLERIFGNTGDAQGKLTAAIDPVIHAFGTLAAAGSDSLPRLATAVGNVADRFNTFITAADGDGRLAKWISDGLDGFSHLGNIVLDLGKSFTAITQAAGGGGGLLGTLDSLTGRMSAFLNSSQGQAELRDFFTKGAQQLGQLRDIAVQAGPALSGLFQAGLNSANLWLPVIRESLDILNRIPGGAEVVITAFVAWKTIQGPLSLFNSLNSLGGALGGLGGKASAAGGAMNSALALVGPIAAAVALDAAYKGILQKVNQITGTTFATDADNAIGPGNMGSFIWGQATGNPQLDAANAKLKAAQDAARAAGPAPQTPGTTPYDPFAVAGIPRPGTAPGSTMWGIPVPATAPVGVGSSSTVVVPPVSSYSPPVVTEVPKGGTPNLPYTGTADPYGGTYSGSGYTSDAALLAAVPAGKYDNGPGDLTKGLADCSSAVEDLVNLMDGKSTAGRSMATGNEAQRLTEMGFLPGMGGPGDFRVGFNASHTQATLPGGTPFNWGSDAAAARGGVGGTGADDPAFTSHYYRPVSGDPMSTMYGGGADPSGALSSQDLTLRNAGQRVNDSQHSQEQAEGRLNELKAKGTATDRQLEAAEYAVAKAKREHQDAIDGLTVAQDKYNKSAQSGKSGGNTDAQALGSGFLSGLGQIFGLDGSVFADPTSFGLFKIFQGVMGLKPSSATATSGGGQGGPGGGGGGGLGGLLGLAQNFMPGGPGMPGMPAGNSPNLMDAVQFAPTGGPGSPGPGNNPGGAPLIDMRGANLGVDPAGFNQTLGNVTSSMNRWAPLQQNLPH